MATCRPACVRFWILPGPYDATVLAEVGLQRLQLSEAITQVLPLEVMLPAPRSGSAGHSMPPRTRLAAIAGTDQPSADATGRHCREGFSLRFGRRLCGAYRRLWLSRWHHPGTVGPGMFPRWSPPGEGSAQPDTGGRRLGVACLSSPIGNGPGKTGFGPGRR